jgi:hypothetical protein
MGTRTKKQEATICFCDVCKREDNMSYGSGGRCEICGIDVCGLCSVADPNDMGGYPYRYCRKCWDVGIPFREEIARIENEASNSVDAQLAKWTAAIAKLSKDKK